MAIDWGSLRIPDLIQVKFGSADSYTKSQIGSCMHIPASTLHSGGCHCGRVRFEVEAPAHLQLDVCNCSMCQRSGYKHLIVPADRFKLLSGQDSLTTYTFNTGTARHLFCSFCGIKSFYVPRSHPDGFSVNANCLDDGTVTGVTLRQVDGRHWEAHYPDGKGAYDV